LRSSVRSISKSGDSKSLQGLITATPRPAGQAELSVWGGLYLLRRRRQPEIDGVVTTWMSTGASLIPAPAHACAMASGLALGLMLTCPAAEPPCLPVSVKAATPGPVVSEMVNLIVPY
jgi:CBS-domain-containing membrane protein